MSNVRSMERGGVRLQAPLCDRRVITEVTEDFSLPDYQPEIKRLLQVRATVSPAERYVGAGVAELSGGIGYTVLYTGEDGEVYCTSQTGEYRFSVPLDSALDFELGEGLLCDVETAPESATGRVIAPRRLSVRCRLRSRVRILGTRLLSESVSGVSEASIERLTGSARTLERFCGVSEPLRLSDEILTDAKEETLRVICADASAIIGETSAGSGSVTLRGEVLLRLLCTLGGEGGRVFSKLRRIPFTGSVPVEGAEVNCTATARGTVTEITVSVEEGRILCEAALLLEARAERNVELCYTKDAFSTEADGECDVCELSLPLLLRVHSGSFSLNATLPLAEAGIPSDASVADLTAEPYVTALESENGRFVLSGKCRCFALLHVEGDTVMQELELPFRYVTEGGGEEVRDFDAAAVATACRARTDGERIHVDAELAVTFSARGGSDARVMTSAELSSPLPSVAASYLIAYPSREDTLWSVAKRYHRPVEKLMRLNPIAESPAADAADSLSGVRYLLL